MSAIKSSKAKKIVRSLEKKNWIKICATGIVVAGVVGGAGYYCINEILVPTVRNSTIEEIKGNAKKVYIATKDIKQGEEFTGAIQEIGCPDYLIPGDVISVEVGLNGKVAAEDISKASIITKCNSYDPNIQDTIVESSRDIIVRVLDNTKIKDGDYIDIRVKTHKNAENSEYEDRVVVAKKKARMVGEELHLVLTENELLNFNDAIVLCANEKDSIEAELYTTTYVKPNTQEKSKVDYKGKGVKLSVNEIDEATKKLEADLEAETDKVENNELKDSGAVYKGTENNQ